MLFSKGADWELLISVNMHTACDLGQVPYPQHRVAGTPTPHGNKGLMTPSTSKILSLF